MDSQRNNVDEQSALWNGTAGRAWVETQDLLDRIFQPIEDLLVQAVCASNPQRLLDVGCGTGGTTLAAGRRLGAGASCVGIDISDQMIAAARSRAQRDGLPVSFVCDDAGRHAFEAQAFDLIISRFGVMFFDDAVGAFKRLRQATRHNGRLHFYAWRSAEDNPFMTTAERAARTYLPEMPTRQPDEPGQFAFARTSRMSDILEESGWSAIRIDPVDVACTFPAAELDRYLSWMGPLGRVLQQMDGGDRQRIIDNVQTAFDPYVVDDQVRFTAACWCVNAIAA